MKKSTIAILITGLVSFGAAADNFGGVHQSGKENDVDIEIGNIENMLAHMCNQSGNQNSCSVSVDNVNGDLNIADGANVTINETTVVQGTENNLESDGFKTDDYIYTTTIDRTEGNGTSQKLTNDGKLSMTVFEDGSISETQTVDLVTSSELTNALKNINFEDTDTVRSDAEIKAIADVGDKILGNEIDALRDETVAKNNAQDTAIKTQWDLIQDVEAKNAEQDVALAGKVDREEFEASQAAQDKKLAEAAAHSEQRDQQLAGAITVVDNKVNDLGDRVTGVETELAGKVDREEFEASQAAQDAELDRLTNDVDAAQSTADQAFANSQLANEKADANTSAIADQQEQINQTADRVTSVENNVADLDNRVTGVEAELGNKVNYDEFLADQDRQDQAIADVNNKVDGVQDQVNNLDGRVNDVEQVANAAMDQAISAQLTGEYAQELAYGALEGVQANSEAINQVAADSLERDNNLLEAIDDTHEKSLERDNMIVDYVVADQERQDAVIAANDKASKERDAELAKAVTTVDAKAEANKAEIAKVETESKDRDAAIVANQAKVDAAQDKVFNDYRVVQEQVDAGQFAAIDELYNATGDLYKTQAEHSVAIAGLNTRVSDLEKDVSGLKRDVKRLDGMIAANLAAASMETPINWNGDLAVQVGVGHYNGSNALALGVMGGNEQVVLKATIAASDADNWNNVAAAASATFSTSLLK